MKNFIFTVAFLTLLAAGCQQAGVKPSTQTTQYLFVQTSLTGSLKLLDATQGSYLLTMKNVTTNTVYFSDRPVRKAGQVSTEAFLTKWGEGEHSFDREPPNAALDFIDESRHNHVVVVQLEKPRMTPDKTSLEYEVKVVPDPPDGNAAAHPDISGLDEGKPVKMTSLYNVALFIDQQAAPACSDQDVSAGINPSNTRFKSQMDSCAISSLGNAEKSADCISRIYPALSRSCSACFGKTAQCMASHCSLQCMMNHFSDSCRSCARSECVDPATGAFFSLVQCTGLRRDQLPP